MPGFCLLDYSARGRFSAAGTIQNNSSGFGVVNSGKPAGLLEPVVGIEGTVTFGGRRYITRGSLVLEPDGRLTGTLDLARNFGTIGDDSSDSSKPETAAATFVVRQPAET